MLSNKKALDCEGVRELMFEYLDGELDEASRAALESHLGGCEACRRELDECRRMLTLVADAAYSAPAALYSGVMEKTANMAQDSKILAPRFKIKPWMSSALAVAAAVAIIFVGRGFIDAPAANMMSPDKAFDAAPADVVGEAVGDALDYAKTYEMADAAPVVNPDYSNEYEETGASGGFTIDTYYGMSPSITAQGEAAEDVHDGADPDTSVLDTVYTSFKGDDTALIVCFKSDVDGVIPIGDAVNITVDGAQCEHYLIDTDAMVKFMGYLEVLEYNGTQYRAVVPTSGEFDSFEIILISDAKE